MNNTAIILEQQSQIETLTEICCNYVDMVEKYKVLVADLKSQIAELEEKQFVRNEN